MRTPCALPLDPPLILHFGDRRGAVSLALRYRNRAEITVVLMCEQKPYPVLDLRSIMGCPAGISTIRYTRSVYMYTAISRKVVGKNVYATIPKGNMGYE